MQGERTDVIPVEGAALDALLDATWPIWHGGLDRQAYGRFHAARIRTAWGRRCQRRFALIAGGQSLATAEQYDLAGTIDGRAVRICGIGAVFTEPKHRGSGHARALVETLLDRSAQAGAQIALFFAQPGLLPRPGSGTPHTAAADDDSDEVGRLFEAIPMTDVTLRVTESPRHGAPMTMVRGGDERDLAAIVAMGTVRAGPVRFHLDRDSDFIHHAITQRRLVAGLGSPNARQLHFFIAEEGITAAAYVVVSVAGESWQLEECGDRDPSGARVGALLQALIAREPAERRPLIHGWLPPRFLPPQATVVSEARSHALVMIRALSDALPPDLSAGDVLYWLSDLMF